MYLLEHDAKTLLARHDVRTPLGVIVEHAGELEKTKLPPGPWVVKGQIAAGGRGKAGIIRKAATPEAAAEAAGAILGAAVKGRTVHAVRIEQQVQQAEEAYIALLLDAAAGGVRVIMSTHGGMDIEAVPAEEIRSAVASLDVQSIVQCVGDIASAWPDAKGRALREAGERLAEVFVAREAMLVEVNPLFVHGDGSWVAGDAKLVTDDNALERQPDLKAMLERRGRAYPEAAVKLHHGFDYVVVDPEGEIGLLTTGAGLSMMLIDELRQQDLKPYNFLDIRTGGMRGDPGRLVNVLRWMTEGKKIRVLLINIFAGITDLGEFSRLLVTALGAVPELQVPVVARLVGNGLPEARPILEAGGVHLYTDLAAAVAETRRLLEGTAQ
ncbi:MAG: ATP-grasp domain-containing protein [Rhodospirillaceae bacterium]